MTAGRGVVTLGECMLRLSVEGGETLEEAERFRVFVGGAEANVAVALARLGRHVRYVSRVGDGPHGRRVVAHLRKHGVDTSYVTIDPERRTGLYFTEVAGEPRGVSVVYDRAASAATAIGPDDLDADQFAGVGVAMVSGITVALGASCRAAVDRFGELARGAGARVVVDVNYRARLWDASTAAAALGPVCRDADVVLCTSEDARTVFGVDDAADRQAETLAERWTAAVVVTDGAAGVCWWAGGVGGAASAITTETHDRIGAGDAFCAGVVDGVLDGDLAVGIRRGQAMASLARTTAGDCFLGTRADVERVLADDGRAPARRVRR
jgi:2-dehydro-3-deoxygluconokinase